MAGRERPGDAEPVAHEVEPVLEEQLDRPERVERAAELPDRVERGVDVVEREQGDHDVRRPGHEPEPGGGDHRERALAPAREPGEVVAGVVLLEAVEAAHDAAVGEHGLDAEDLAAGRRRSAARACRPALVATVPPTVAVSRAAEVDAVVPARGVRVLVQPGDRDAGLRGDLPGARRRPGSSASSRRRSSTTSPCSGTDPPTRPVLPPWGTTGAPASPHARSTARDLVDGARANDRGCRSREAAGPVAYLTGDDVGIGEHVRVADRDPQTR